MKAPVFVAPAMDLDMMNHPSTKHNLDLLHSYGNHIIEPAVGELASHLVGKGRMEEPENIVKALDDFFSSCRDLAGRKVLVTAGPTYEKIDPVRFIGNYSSGKMGFSIAEECAARGAEVILVSGPVSLTCHNSAIKRIDVESAAQMLDAAVGEFSGCDAAVMCAAVADYCVANQASHKIKRETDDVPVIHLQKNKDIAATLGASKRQGQVLVGFALETDNEIDNAVAKLRRKNLDFIVLNSLRDPDAGFISDTNKVTVIRSTGEKLPFATKPKSLVAKDIVDIIVHDYLNEK
jgi:phosphopantothenoylcysteine decarboxylase/phosphopantothenate--cysteine ligase